MEFSQWLIEEIEKRGWRQSDLVRRSGISQGAISRVILGTRSPGPDLCTAIAKAFNIRPEYVFRKAGLLDKKEEEDPPDLEELKNLYIVASKEVRRDILEYARFKSYRQDRP